MLDFGVGVRLNSPFKAYGSITRFISAPPTKMINCRK